MIDWYEPFDDIDCCMNCGLPKATHTYEPRAEDWIVCGPLRDAGKVAEMRAYADECLERTERSE